MRFKTYEIPDVGLVVGEGTFLKAVRWMNEGKCSAIFGPQGGIISISTEVGKGLIPRAYSNRSDFSNLGIYFSAENYLGTWRCIK